MKKDTSIHPNPVADLPDGGLKIKHYCDYQNRQWNMTGSRKGGLFRIVIRPMDDTTETVAEGEGLEETIMEACSRAGAPFSLFVAAKKKGGF